MRRQVCAEEAAAAAPARRWLYACTVAEAVADSAGLGHFVWDRAATLLDLPPADPVRPTDAHTPEASRGARGVTV